MEALKKKEERKKQKDKKKKLRKLRAEKAALERQLRDLMESSGDESEEEVRESPGLSAVMIVLLSVLFQVRLVWLSLRNRELQVRLGIKLKNLNYGPMWQPSFSELDFRLFVAAELEIVTSAKTSEAEKTGRVHLLKQLAYLCGRYSFESLKGFMHILFLK